MLKKIFGWKQRVSQLSCRGAVSVKNGSSPTLMAEKAQFADLNGLAAALSRISSDQLKQGASEERAAHRAAPLRRRRILVVEDNRDAAEVLKTLLQWWGHEVLLAFDGPTALEAARAYRPEVALLDIGLPGMHGYEVAERIRKQAELREVVLVALTGLWQPDRFRAQEAGFDHHLTKPLNRATLERLLAALE